MGVAVSTMFLGTLEINVSTISMFKRDDITEQPDVILFLIISLKLVQQKRISSLVSLDMRYDFLMTMLSISVLARLSVSQL